MNKSYSTLIVVALAALVIGGLISHLLFPKPGPRPRPTPEDSPAPYILNFGSAAGDKVDVDVGAFETALSKPAPRWSDLKIDGQPFNPPAPAPGAVAVHLIQRFDITQTDNDNNFAPCVIHVTQRVALDDLDQVQRVLKTIQTHK